MPTFDGLVLSGGGVRGIAQLGALQYYSEQGVLKEDDVTVVAGTSVGALIGLLYVCGYHPLEIWSEIYNTESLLSSSAGNTPILAALKNGGLMSVDTFVGKAEKMVSKKFGSVPTFMELHEKTGMIFIATAVNVNKGKVVYFSHTTHPDLNVISAVKMSCNLPFIFERITYQDEYHVDGGLLDNFPFEPVVPLAKNILGILTPTDIESVQINGLLTYFYELIMIPITTLTKLRCRDLPDTMTMVEIKTSRSVTLQTSMTYQEKMDFFVAGYDAAKKADMSPSVSPMGDGEWSVDWPDF